MDSWLYVIKMFCFIYSSDNHNSAELLGAFPTKSTPVIYLNFTTHNVLQAAGAVWDIQLLDPAVSMSSRNKTQRWDLWSCICVVVHVSKFDCTCLSVKLMVHTRQQIWWYILVSKSDGTYLWAFLKAQHTCQ